MAFLYAIRRPIRLSKSRTSLSNSKFVLLRSEIWSLRTLICLWTERKMKYTPLFARASTKLIRDWLLVLMTEEARLNQTNLPYTNYDAVFPLLIIAIYRPRQPCRPNEIDYSSEVLLLWSLFMKWARGNRRCKKLDATKRSRISTQHR